MVAGRGKVGITDLGGLAINTHIESFQVDAEFLADREIGIETGVLDTQLDTMAYVSAIDLVLSTIQRTEDHLLVEGTPLSVVRNDHSFKYHVVVDLELPVAAGTAISSSVVTLAVLALDNIDGGVHFADRSFTEDAEITIEANPGTFTKEKALAWRKVGINRVSVGVQAFDDTLLKRLGRIHSSSTAYAQIKLLHECGFDNISLDLIFGLPGQTLSMWQDTLKVACELPIQHISCYSLIVEEGTPFYQDYQTGLLTLPDEETERQMAHFAISYLKEQGFYQHEISNFSKKGFESIHNNGYWEGVPYLGLGLGASSLAVDQNGEEWRFSKNKNYKEYCHYYSKEDCSKLSLEDRMSEFVFLGLRKTCGISRKEFIIRFGRTIESVYGEALQKHLQDGLLQQIDDRYSLTNLGLDLANQVMEDFV